MQSFVSHSSEDTGIYTALCLALDGAKLQRWKQTEMTPSDSLANQLRQAIHQCQVCVFIVTRCSIGSKWCLAEVGAFWGAAKKVFLYLGESGLSDSDLPIQFRGSFWTRDASVLIEHLTKEAEVPLVLAHERPANVYWLGHDLVRSSELIGLGPDSRKEFEMFLLQSLHHLNEIGLANENDKATFLLLRALALTVEGIELDKRGCEEVRDLIYQAKDEIGERIKRLQNRFEVWSSPERNQQWKESARRLLNP